MTRPFPVLEVSFFVGKPVVYLSLNCKKETNSLGILLDWYFSRGVLAETTLNTNIELKSSHKRSPPPPHTHYTGETIYFELLQRGAGVSWFSKFSYMDY